MSDFPQTVQFPKGIITPQSLESIGAEMASIANVGVQSASRAWPSTNLAILFPFRIGSLFTIAQCYWQNGSTVGTNSRDLGVYDYQGNLIVHTGNVLTVGASTIQKTALSAIITPGLYYLALSQNGTTDTIFGFVPNAVLLRAFGTGNVATSNPLPSTITFAGATNTLFPGFGISSESII